MNLSVSILEDVCFQGMDIATVGCLTVIRRQLRLQKPEAGYALDKKESLNHFDVTGKCDSTLHVWKLIFMAPQHYIAVNYQRVRRAQGS